MKNWFVLATVLSYLHCFECAEFYKVTTREPEFSSFSGFYQELQPMVFRKIGTSTHYLKFASENEWAIGVGNPWKSKLSSEDSKKSNFSITIEALKPNLTDYYKVTSVHTNVKKK